MNRSNMIETLESRELFSASVGCLATVRVDWVRQAPTASVAPLSPGPEGTSLQVRPAFPAPQAGSTPYIIYTTCDWANVK